MRPPKPRPEATVCTVPRGNIAELIATALSPYSLFLLSLRTMGYRGEQCSGGRTLLRTHGENYSLREELAQNRGILRSPCGRFEQSDTGESCGVEMAERVGVEPTIHDHDDWIPAHPAAERGRSYCDFDNLPRSGKTSKAGNGAETPPDCSIRSADRS